jgi:hypothetical protein
VLYTSSGHVLYEFAHIFSVISIVANTQGVFDTNKFTPVSPIIRKGLSDS